MASSAHYYLNWAKERIDEMDAVLTSFESKATQIATESRATQKRPLRTYVRNVLRFRSR
jgi:hypothetical protein